MLPSEELLHSEHVSPSELQAPPLGGSSEDKGGLQALDSKDGELIQIQINPVFGDRLQPTSFLIPQSLGGVSATTMSGKGWGGMLKVVEASIGSLILLPWPWEGVSPPFLQ